jgi:hypothetical protein
MLDEKLRLAQALPLLREWERRSLLPRDDPERLSWMPRTPGLMIARDGQRVCTLRYLDGTLAPLVRHPSWRGPSEPGDGAPMMTVIVQPFPGAEPGLYVSFFQSSWFNRDGRIRWQAAIRAWDAAIAQVLGTEAPPGHRRHPVTTGARGLGD